MTKQSQLQKRIRTKQGCLPTVGFLFLALILASCVRTQPDGLTDKQSRSTPSLVPTVMESLEVHTATLVPSVISRATSIPTPNPSSTPMLSESATPSPSVEPATLTSVVPPPSPLPTIPPQDRGRAYADLVASNGGCELPCWWGLVLGESSLGDVRQRYAPFQPLFTEQTFPSGVASIYALFEDPQIENGTQLNHAFVAQDGVVIEAMIEIDRHPDYQIEPLLNRLGQPHEIWLRTLPNFREGILPMYFLLFYPDKGVLISYAMDGERDNNHVLGCFNGLGGVAVRLWDPLIWDPDGDKGFLDRTERGDFSLAEGYLPIEEVSNWDAERFYIVLSDPGHTECLETPAGLWPEP